MVKKKEEDYSSYVSEIEDNSDTKAYDTQLIQSVAESEVGNEEDFIIEKDEDSSSESFFRSVVTQMNDKQNISMKTEYLNVQENFSGAKLEFLADFGYMPFLKRFIRILEIKRVSLQRKGRQENVMMLQERRQEIEQERADMGRRFFIG